jgi:hypothetical protein
MISNLNNIDLYEDGVEISYSREYNCLENGCRDICRCSIIVDIETKVDTNRIIEKIYNIYFDDSLETKRNSKLSELLWDIGDNINLYTIDRISRYFKIWDNIEVNKTGGFYGEEIESVKISNSEKLVELINKGLSINDLNSRIEYLLDLEYGYLLPELEKRNWELSEINIDDIEIRNESHLESVYNKDLKHYDTYKGIMGVVILTKNDKWRLIDGYHRLSKVKKGKVKILKGY